MAGPAPKTEKWTAHENLHDYKEKADHLHLLVGGTVEVSDADKRPVLKQASGGGPKTLTLDLSIEPCSDPAVGCAVWKAANFDTIVEADQYDSVDVRWDGKVIASTPVINDIDTANCSIISPRRRTKSPPRRPARARRRSRKR